MSESAGPPLWPTARRPRYRPDTQPAANSPALPSWSRAGVHISSSDAGLSSLPSLSAARSFAMSDADEKSPPAA